MCQNQQRSYDLQKWVGYESEECVKISKEAMTYKSGSVMKMSHLMQNLCGVIN